MKVKYIGKTTIPLALAMATIPAVTNGKVYNLVTNNENSDYYVIIDDDGIAKVIKKELFEIVKEN